MSGPYAYTPYIWPMLATGAFISVVVIYAWRRRSVPGALSLAITMLFAVLWAVGAALELAAVDDSTKIFWFNTIVAVCIMPLAIARFCFVLEYAGLGRWLTRRNLVLLSIPPLLQFLLTITNDWHHWLMLGYVVDGTVNSLPRVGGWTLTSFSYLLFLVNLIILVRLFFRSPRHRWPVALIICAMFSTHTFYALDVFNLNPFAPLYASVLSMNISFVMYGLALFRFRMFDPIPMARQTVIEQMREGMLVLDTGGKIVDLNPAAENILGQPADRVRGRDAAQVLPAYAEVSAGKAQAEISLPEGRQDGVGTGSTLCHYELTLSPLKDRNEQVLGHLLLLHDVTAQKQARAQLLEQQRALAMLAERERLARELHDGIGQVLGYVKMQAQAARDRLAQDQKEAADNDLAQLVAVAQDAHADVREYILGAKSAAFAQPGFLPVLRQYLSRFSEHYALRTELSAPPDWSDDVLEPTEEAQLLRIIQEALTNARKHAHAQCVQVSIALEEGRAQIIVQDNGVGFDPARLADGEGQKYGMGFMRERAEEVGGSVEIQSAPGQGTRVVVQLPVSR